MAGALTAATLNILGSHVYTLRGGLALEVALGALVGIGLGIKALIAPLLN